VANPDSGSTPSKPFSQACENNKAPILAVLQRVFDHSSRVLELGSGTGQHACYFAPALPHLEWQPSELSENIAGLCQWVDACNSPNLLPPLLLDVSGIEWPSASHDAVFSANTAHILSWSDAQLMIKRVAEKLPTGGIFALYGPFKYDGLYTSQSNHEFDCWLKQQHPERGIRDFEQVVAVAKSRGLMLYEDNPMPANNRLLVWVKQPMGLADDRDQDNP